MSRVAKVVRRNMVETAEQKVGQDRVATMATTGEPEIEHESLIEVESGAKAARIKDKAEILAFMEEVVTVIVAPTSDPQAPGIVEVWNAGRPQRFVRGMEQQVKRKFVEVLARAKPVNYGNEEYRDPAGNQSVRWPGRMSLLHPFTVVNDTPRGQAWLKAILAEPA